MDPFYSPATRIVNVVRGRTGEITLAGFQALDELHHTIETAHSERRYIGTDGAPVIESTLSGVFEEAEPLRAFWISFIHRSQGEYLITRFEKIKSSAYADVLCSGLINHFWFWHEFNASEAECTVPAMALCFDHLFHQGPMGCAIIVAPPVVSTRSWEEQLCTSWRGSGGSKEREMVSDVASALGSLPNFYSPARDSGYDGKSHTSLPGAAYCAQKLIELSNLWQIYCGRGPGAFETAPCTQLYLHLPAWIFDWGYHNAYIHGTNPSDHVLPAWRFLCFDHKEKSMRQRSSSESRTGVTCFDVKAPKSKQLMDQFGRASSYKTYISLVGTSQDEELCLETILEEVWADAEGQFDHGWQQLYMLACLKKHFGDLWNVPEDPDDFDFEIDSYYEDEP
jgi:hypothetical protein